MGLLDETAVQPKKIMTLFYLIDASGSMSGTRIGTVNAAMEECIPLLEEVAANNGDAEIKVAILEFSSRCLWITPETEPSSLEGFKWTDINAGGLTDFGAALKELNKKLSKDGFLKSATGAYAPVILLLSDGEPTDDWEKELESIKKNNWFKHAIKIAINIEDSNKDVLSKFTGNVEAIIDVNDQSTLKSMIRKVSVTSSMVASTNSVDVEEPEKTSADIVKKVEDEVKDETTVNVDNNLNWQNW